MPIMLRHNDVLELNLAEYRGEISLTELDAVAGYLAANPSFLKSDTLSVAHDGATFAAVPMEALDRLFGRYKTLFAPLDFQMLRRSAWLCFSEAAQEHVDYWIGERDTREAFSSTLRQLGSYAEAGEWLVLSPAETAMLESGEGFALLASFDYPLTSGPAR